MFRGNETFAVTLTLEHALRKSMTRLMHVHYHRKSEFISEPSTERDSFQSYRVLWVFFISFINQHSPRAVLREPSVGVKWRRQRRKIARDVRNVIIVKVLVCSDKEQMNAAFVSFRWCFFVLGMWKCPQCHPGTRKRKIYEWCYCYRYSVVFFTGY